VAPAVRASGERRAKPFSAPVGASCKDMEAARGASDASSNLDVSEQVEQETHHGSPAADDPPSCSMPWWQTMSFSAKDPAQLEPQMREG
jgi:hypothetical protein